MIHVLKLNDVIDATTVKAVETFLATSVPSGDLHVMINSAGGAALPALEVHRMLQAWPGHVTVTIEAVAGGAAAWIAMAGDTIRIHEHGLMQFALPSIQIQTDGDAGDLRKAAEVLDRIRDHLDAIFEGRLTPSQLDKLLKSGAWCTAREAVSHGIADEMVPAQVAVYPKPPRFRAGLIELGLR